MSDVLGNSLKLSIFGESHGPMIGATISGLPSGIKIDEEFIASQMNKRKANDILSTQRQEDDIVTIVSGTHKGYTTGTALTVIIENKKQHSSDYKNYFRPGHADYSGFVRYNSFNDPRGGGHFSGRLTAPLVAIGAIIISYLEEKGIKIGSRIKEIHGIKDDEIENIDQAISKFNKEIFPTISEFQKSLMYDEIIKAKENLDSVGGTIETFVTGIKAGIGNPFFDSIESCIAHAIFSIPAVKGIEFGLGFKFKNLYGSEANDQMRIEDNKINFLSNNNGGINGGITNGMPIVFKTCIKPTPSIYKKQLAIGGTPLTNIDLEIQGRHDPCIVRRALVVINSLTAFTILDCMLSR